MIECIRYYSVNKGALMGKADLFLPNCGMEIFGCLLFQKNGRKWVNLPSKEYTDQNGEKKYSPLLRFRNQKVFEEFVKQAVKVIEDKCQRENIQMVAAASVPSQSDEIPF